MKPRLARQLSESRRGRCGLLTALGVLTAVAQATGPLAVRYSLAIEDVTYRVADIELNRVRTAIVIDGQGRPVLDSAVVWKAMEVELTRLGSADHAQAFGLLAEQAGNKRAEFEQCIGVIGWNELLRWWSQEAGPQVVVALAAAALKGGSSIPASLAKAAAKEAFRSIIQDPRSYTIAVLVRLFVEARDGMNGVLARTSAYAPRSTLDYDEVHDLWNDYNDAAAEGMAAEALYKQMNTGDLAANLWTSLQSAGQQALEEIELIPDLKLTKELYGRLQKAQDAAGWISYYRISRDGYVLLRAQQNAALVGRRWRQAMDAARQLDRTAGGGKANDARMKFLRLNEQGCEEYLWLKDSSIMVRVPAGSFQMGLPGGEGPDADILPSVYVDEFLVDKCEITNHQYRRFCDEANRPYPEDPGFVHLPGYFVAYPTCPVSNVSMGDAAAYCAWAGKRIPTEAEWGKAARGTVFRLYPWGNSEPNGRLCNAAGRAAPNTRGQPSAVGIHPLGASPYGCMDMAGNVWEWCSSGVPLGGSFASEPDYLCTGSLGYRTPPVRDRDLGFRCVASSVVSAGQADAPILPLSDVEEEPRQIWTPELEYPADARRAGIEGVAVLRVLVDTSGAVAQCEIQESSGNESLDRAALSAARRTRYTPARCRGQPVRVWTTFSCQFAR